MNNNSFKSNCRQRPSRKPNVSLSDFGGSSSSSSRGTFHGLQGVGASHGLLDRYMCRRGHNDVDKVTMWYLPCLMLAEVHCSFLAS